MLNKILIIIGFLGLILLSGYYLNKKFFIANHKLEENNKKTKMEERYKDKIPLDEIVISPKSLFESPLLRTIKASGDN